MRRTRAIRLGIVPILILMSGTISSTSCRHVPLSSCKRPNDEQKAELKRISRDPEYQALYVYIRDVLAEDCFPKEAEGVRRDGL